MFPFKIAPDNLSQAINPWTWWSQVSDNVTGLININNYRTDSAVTEEKVIREVAGYGMQLDVIEHAIEALIASFPTGKLTAKQKQSIAAFEKMMKEIRQAKEKILLDKVSPEGIERFIADLKKLQEKNPESYKKVSKRLKEAL